MKFEKAMSFLRKGYAISNEDWLQTGYLIIRHTELSEPVIEYVDYFGVTHHRIPAKLDSSILNDKWFVQKSFLGENLTPNKLNIFIKSLRGVSFSESGKITGNNKTC